jgi:hypothetical protein
LRLVHFVQILQQGGTSGGLDRRVGRADGNKPRLQRDAHSNQDGVFHAIICPGRKCLTGLRWRQLNASAIPAAKTKPPAPEPPGRGIRAGSCANLCISETKPCKFQPLTAKTEQLSYQKPRIQRSEAHRFSFDSLAAPMLKSRRNSKG